VCKQILIYAKLKTGKRGQKTSDWEKSIKESGVCLLRRRRRSVKVAQQWII